MDDKSFNIRVPKRWARIALIVGVTSLIVAPLTAWASHTFNDVPNSHTFHNDIEWLEASGVTKGCNPPDNTEYCPDDNVTRGQMAAFMRRLATNRVVDADKVDGLDAQELTVAASAEVDSTAGGTAVSEVTTMNEVTIVAPAGGVLLIDGGAYVDVTSAGFGPGIEVYVDDAEVGAMAAFLQSSPGHLSYTTAVEIPAGPHTVRHDVGQVGGFGGGLLDADIFYNANNLSVLFVPSGSVTASASGAGGSLMGD